MTDEAAEAGQSRHPGPGAGRRLVLRYALLTAALFAPLLYAFATLRNLYPVAASTMMVGGWSLARGRTYHVLRGETAEGATVDIPFVSLVDAMHSRATGLVAATVENDSFTQLRRPHPANAALVEQYGGADKVPDAARVPDLLRALGGIYNSRLPEGSARRLKAVRLDEYRWEGGRYGDYDRLVRSWREEL